MTVTGDAERRVAVIGGGWPALVLEAVLGNAGYRAGRTTAEGVPDECVAAVVVGDGVAAMRALRTRGIPCVSVRSHLLAEHDIVETIRAGADAVVCESDGIDAVVAAVETVARGGAVCSPRVARRVIDLLREEVRTGARPNELTARQQTVLELIARGNSVKQTARALGIAAKTVENTQSRLYRRLGVRTRAQAVAVALAEGLIGSDSIAMADHH